MVSPSGEEKGDIPHHPASSLAFRGRLPGGAHECTCFAVMLRRQYQMKVFRHRHYPSNRARVSSCARHSISSKVVLSPSLW